MFSDVDAETAAETKLYDSVKFKIQNKTDGTWIIAKRNDAEGVYYVTGHTDKETDASLSYRIRYVFDISDTNSRENRDISLWQMKPEYENEVIQALQDKFLLNRDGSFLDAVEILSRQLAEEATGDCLPDLLNNKKDSFLEELDNKLIDLIVGHFIRIAGIQVDAGGDHVGYPFGNGWPFHVYLSIGRTDTPVAEKETGTVVDPVVVSTVVAAVFSMLPFQKFLPFLGIRIPDEKGEHIQP